MNGTVTRFGQVEYDAAHGRLSVAGRAVGFDRSCAAILALLIDEAGKEVDKDRLLDVGWPGRTVHENSLAKAIGRLRHALGEDGRALETVHGYGYRLAADPIFAPASAPHLRAFAVHRFRRFAPVAAVLVIATAAALWLGSAGEPSNAVETQLLRGEPIDAIGRVLWVDDHPENIVKERRHFEQSKVAVYHVTTSDDALEMLAMYDFGAVISDMGRHDKPLAGLKLVREMRRRQDATPFYLYTIAPSAAQRQLLDEAGGQGVTVKSADLYAAVLPIFEKGAAATALD